MAWLAIAVGIASLVVFGFIHSISPREITVTRMVTAETRIRLYWTSQGKLPNRLSDLPQLPSRDNSIKDGWGGEIEYKTDGTKVTLRSLGGDPKLVASKDIVRSFDVSKERE